MKPHLTIVPCELRDANAFVAQWHRHSKPVRGHRFSVAVELAGKIVGVAIVGRPIARRLQDGWTVEVLRVATDGTRNACSRLYGACVKAAFAIGYRRVVTYTLKSEPGSSLRGTGFKVIADVRAQGWSRPSRPREPGLVQERLRWELVA